MSLLKAALLTWCFAIPMLAADKPPKEVASSPTKQWKILRYKNSETMSDGFILQSNEFVVQTHKDGIAVDRRINLPPQSLVITTQYPEYDFGWSKDEKWMWVSVRYHYGEQLFVAKLENGKENVIKMRECPMLVSEDAYSEVEAIAFGPKSFIYDISVMRGADRDVSGRYSLTYDLKSSSVQKGEWGAAAKLSTKP